MKEAPRISTTRLELCGIERDDAPLIVAWRSNPDNYRYFRNPHTLTMEEHLRWFNGVYKVNENRFDWLAIEKANLQPVGVFGLIRRENDAAEVNYLLDKTAQGKGYAAEAVNALLEYAKSKWHCSVALAEIHRDNRASIRLANRMGFCPERETGDFIIYRKTI